MHCFTSATLKKKNKTKPKYKFASTMPSCFRKGGKRKKKVLRSGIKKSLAHRESIRRKLLNSISSLITGCSTLARPTPPLATSTSCPRWLGSSVFNHPATGIIKLEEPSAALHTDAASFISAEGCGACRVPRPQRFHPFPTDAL